MIGLNLGNKMVYWKKCEICNNVIDEFTKNCVCGEKNSLYITPCDVIGVVGYGYVGSAVGETFKDIVSVFGIDEKDKWIEHTKRNFSPPSGNNLLENLVEVVKDGPIFICVPTPMKPDGTCDISVVESVVKDISKYTEKTATIVVKSTVVPGTITKLNQKYKNCKVLYNPEFLTEANYMEDFKNQDRIIIGGDPSYSKYLGNIYKLLFPKTSLYFTDSTTAEMIKYTTNSFLATKVSFFNEINQICEKINVDYNEVKNMLKLDSRIGTSHMDVPGPDGFLGFGGKCFSKDINGMIKLAKQKKVKPEILQAAWNKNLEVRPEKDWEQIDGVLS